MKKILDPSKTKEYFKKKGWKKIAGFQTRNPIHKGHEYLHRVALEVCDGLFINPLSGWKKNGDFSEIAILEGYKAMFKEYYKDLNIYFEFLETPMRYAGPREAIFHALIRKNLGCTHFIIGRDHAGVGNYYGKYEAQELALELTKNKNLNRTVLLSEPFTVINVNKLSLKKHVITVKNIKKIRVQKSEIFLKTTKDQKNFI